MKLYMVAMGMKLPFPTKGQPDQLGTINRSTFQTTSSQAEDGLSIGRFD